MVIVPTSAHILGYLKKSSGAAASRTVSDQRTHVSSNTTTISDTTDKKLIGRRSSKPTKLEIFFTKPFLF
jgi:hypothetical protein